MPRNVVKNTKTTTLIIDKDNLHSFVEGGLWSMRLMKEHESVVNIVANGDNYEVTLLPETNKDQSELPW